VEGKADNKQKALIHLALAQLNMGDEVYREYLAKTFGVRSSKDLDYDQATKLIDQFKKWGFKLRAKRSVCSYMCEPRKRPSPLPENVLVLVSREQISKIEHLKEDLRWAVWNGFDLWAAKYFGIQGGIKGIKYSKQATKLIEAMKSMWKSQNKCACPLNHSTTEPLNSPEDL
jgi:hypothetical protein